MSVAEVGGGSTGCSGGTSGLFVAMAGGSAVLFLFSSGRGQSLLLYLALVMQVNLGFTNKHCSGRHQHWLPE